MPEEVWFYNSEVCIELNKNVMDHNGLLETDLLLSDLMKLSTFLQNALVSFV